MRVIQPGRDRVRQRDLAVFVLQHDSCTRLAGRRSAAAIARRMLAELVAAAAGFDADQLHAGIRNERVEQPDRVAAAADAGEDRIGQAALGLENLLAAPLRR